MSSDQADELSAMLWGLLDEHRRRLADNEDLRIHGAQIATGTEGATRRRPRARRMVAREAVSRGNYQSRADSTTGAFVFLGQGVLP